MNHRRWLIPAALLVAALQIGVLGWSIISRAAILRDGREILVKVEPVDPRDLLRGDYVRLGYEFSRLPVSLFGDSVARAPESGPATVWVRLRRGDDGLWSAVRASYLDRPAEAAGDDEVDIRGISDYRGTGDDAEVDIDYGIERYFVPEGEGRDIEKDMRERSFTIRAAVAGNGTVAIKALLDDGTVLYEEPLY